MFQWLKVWWHCLTHLHSKCTFTVIMGDGSQKKKHFCECGYNNDGKTWEDVVKFVKEQMEKQNGN